MTSIAEYNPIAAALAELRKQYGATVYEVRTAEGMAAARKARAEIKRYRVDLEAKRKEIKEPALERCRAIDEEAKRITAELRKLEEPIDEAIKAEEIRKEEEKVAKAQAEMARLAAGRAFIDSIKAPVVDLVGKASSEIEAQLERSKAIVIAEDDFADAAHAARAQTVAQLEKMLALSREHEAEQARIKAERAELERLRAEQEAAAKVERDRHLAEVAAKAAREAKESAERAAAIEAEERAANERMAAARAKLEAEQEEARERIRVAEREAAERRALVDMEARKAREQADREAKAARDAEEARLRAEREALEVKRRAEEERERAKRTAEEEAQRLADREKNRRLDARELLVEFWKVYGDLPEFAGVVAAINDLFPGGVK